MKITLRFRVSSRPVQDRGSGIRSGGGRGVGERRLEFN